jgi:hypothetical protein
MPVINVMDENGRNFALQEAEKFRDKAVSRISAISAEVFTYTVKNNEFVDNGKKTIRIADGAECFKRHVWAGENFVQAPDQGKRPLTIRYTFDGKPQSVSFDIATPKTGDYWKIGAVLDEHLRLNIVVGGENQNTIVKDINLSLQYGRL